MDNTVFFGSPTNHEEVASLIFGLMATPVFTQDFTDTDKELVIIMKELMHMHPGNNQHPFAKQLFNWLSNPLRSADEFIYVVGPLEKHLWNDMDSSQYVSDGYVGKIAAEALAAHCPILEGSWEHAAWIVLTVSDSYCASEYGYTSNVLSAWIIHIIGDPDLCPNPYLRIRLMNLLSKLDFNKENKALVLQSILSAFSALKVENGKDCFHLIHKTLSEFNIITDGYILKMDLQLSEILHDMKTSRLSAILHETSDKMCTNPNRYIIPVEVHGLTVLLKTLSGYAQMLYKSRYVNVILTDLHNMCSIFQLIFDNFIMSCQMHQMIDVTAYCIINVFEYLGQATAILFSGSRSRQYTEYTSYQTLGVCEKVLKQLCNKEKVKENALTGLFDPVQITTSPVGQEIIRKYRKRLDLIRAVRVFKILVLGDLESYPTLHVLLYYESIMGTDTWHMP